MTLLLTFLLACAPDCSMPGENFLVVIPVDDAGNPTVADVSATDAAGRALTVACDASQDGDTGGSGCTMWDVLVGEAQLVRVTASWYDGCNTHSGTQQVELDGEDWCGDPPSVKVAMPESTDMGCVE